MAALKIILCLSLMYICSSSEETSANLHFQIFTAFNRYGAAIFTSDTIPPYPINVMKRTIIILEDFQTTADDQRYTSLRNEYFEKDNFNIFMAKLTTSETSSKVLGQDLQDFMSGLLRATREEYLDFHLIGFQTSAEIISEAVASFAEGADFKISRVTLIDPIFEKCADDFIDLDGVDFVDVVHSNNQEATAIGHVDFYPLDQPGCKDNNTLRGLELYTKSINSKDMEAIECLSWSEFVEGACVDGVRVVFGENVDRAARGTFYFVADDKFDTVGTVE